MWDWNGCDLTKITYQSFLLFALFLLYSELKGHVHDSQLAWREKSNRNIIFVAVTIAAATPSLTWIQTATEWQFFIRSCKITYVLIRNWFMSFNPDFFSSKLVCDVNRQTVRKQGGSRTFQNELSVYCSSEKKLLKNINKHQFALENGIQFLRSLHAAAGDSKIL